MIDPLSKEPQLINYKRIKNLQINIDYANNTMHTMSKVFQGVEDLDRHVLCNLAGPELEADYHYYATTKVGFHKESLYAFFMKLREAEQAVKSLTLCLEMDDFDWVTLLMKNSREDPLVATGFVRTLTKLIELRKVVIEISGALEYPNDKRANAFPTSKLVQRLSKELGPCIVEKSQYMRYGGPTFFKRLAFFPAAYSRSKEA